MTQDNRTSTKRLLFGFTGRDLVLLSLIFVLIIGLIPLRRLRPEQSTTPATPVAAVATTMENPSPTSTNPPTQALTSTPTLEATSTPTNIPIDTPTPIPDTPTNTPIPIPTDTPMATLTVTAAVTISTTVTDSLTETEEAAPPPISPTPVAIVYPIAVGDRHTLKVVTSQGSPLPENFPNYAVAPAWAYGGAIAFVGEEGITQSGDTRGNGVWLISPGQSHKQLISVIHIKNLTSSPDGRRLVFEVTPPGEQSEIRTIDAETGSEIRPFFKGQEPAYSPDGQKLAIRDCEPCALYIINADGTNKTPAIIENTANSHYPTWSPDSKYLAFSDNRDGNWEIYLLQLDNGNLTRLTDSPSTETTPVFSPNGREIYLLSDKDGARQIISIPIDSPGNNLTNVDPIATDVWLPEDTDPGLARPAVR